MANLVAQNTRDQTWLCKMLGATESGTDEQKLSAVASMWRDAGYDDCEIGWAGAEGVRPGVLTIQTATQVIVLVEGTGSAQQAASYAQGALSKFHNEFGELVNETFWKMSQFILLGLRNVGGLIDRSIILGGHSYGGAVATCMARQLAATGLRDKIELVTWGAPRCGDQRFVDGIPIARWVRFMGSADPVPFLPPHPDEIPDQFRDAVVARVDVTDAWEQGGLGLVLFDTGLTITRKYPEFAPTGPDSNLIEYFFELGTAAFRTHLFSIYVDAMVKRFDRITRSVSGLVRSVLNSPRTSARITTADYSFYFGVSSMPYVMIPLSSLPRIVRVGPQTYSIYWGGASVFSNLKKGSAKATLRKFVMFLKRFPVGTTDRTQLGIALDAFLAQAQAGGAGWSPNPWTIE